MRKFKVMYLLSNKEKQVFGGREEISKFLNVSPQYVNILWLKNEPYLGWSMERFELKTRKGGERYE